MAAIGLTGGAALDAKLAEIAKKLGEGGTLRVGFLENATYPDGTPVAQVAAVQEFGARINHPGGARYVIGADGMATFVNNDFVGPAHGVTKSHVINVPARPFFRTVLAQKAPKWGAALGKIAVSVDYDVNQTLGKMGEGIKGQLQGSIQQLTSPPLAPSTVKAKGFDKPLIDSGHLLSSVDYEVDT